MLYVESESKYFVVPLYWATQIGEGRGELIQLKCGYVEISEEIIEILPAGNEKMFDSVEHWPG